MHPGSKGVTISRIAFKICIKDRQIGLPIPQSTYINQGPFTIVGLYPKNAAQNGRDDHQNCQPYYQVTSKVANSVLYG